jgi:methionyl-tRNA formyltransferase
VVNLQRILFFGTPAFAVPSLEALIAAGMTVPAVICQPDRPKGRGQKVSPPPVKIAAEAHGLSVLQPERLRDEAFLETIRGLQPDLAVVAAYGRLLPQVLLDIHASLLPRWRGAAPIHRAVLAGDDVTGISIMRVVLALDAGPTLEIRGTTIDPNETSAALEARLAAMGGELLISSIRRLEAEGEAAAWTPQDEHRVTYAEKITRADSPINWCRPARAIHDQIRGLQPWPLASATIGGRRLMIHASRVEPGRDISAEPGQIVEIDRDSFLVAARPGLVRILSVQPEGRKVMGVRDFLNGSPVRVGESFDLGA